MTSVELANTTVSVIAEAVPEMVQVQDGTWLAIAPAESAVRVGAHGATREDAAEGFRAAIRRLQTALAPTAP